MDYDFGESEFERLWADEYLRGHSEFFKCGFGYGAGNRRSPAGQPHTLENFPRMYRRVYRGKNSQTAMTVGTIQNVEFENPFHQFRPRIISATILLPSQAVSTFAGIHPLSVFGNLRDNCSAPLCRRTQQPVEPDQIHAG